jgi:hypothetical protein
LVQLQAYLKMEWAALLSELQPVALWVLVLVHWAEQTTQQKPNL